jgi:hypothetical protein
LQINCQIETAEKGSFETKAVPGKKSLDFLFEEINTLKRQLKPEKTASSKKRRLNPSSLLKLMISI